MADFEQLYNTYFNDVYLYILRLSGNEHIDESEMRELPDLAPSVAEEYARRDELDRIQKILHDVGDPYKEVFMWRALAAFLTLDTFAKHTGQNIKKAHRRRKYSNCTKSQDHRLSRWS